MGLISKLLGQNQDKEPSGLSIGGSISLGYKPTPKENIYAHQFSCMNRDEDCTFCKRLDGTVIAPDDPIIKHLMSDKDPDEQHPFGYRTETFQRLCSCKVCGCIWVDILKDEEIPPPIEMPEDLRDEILKATEQKS